MFSRGLSNKATALLKEDPDYKRYLDNLPKKDKYKLHMANSIWVKEDKDFNKIHFSAIRNLYSIIFNPMT